MSTHSADARQVPVRAVWIAHLLSCAAVLAFLAAMFVPIVLAGLPLPPYIVVASLWQISPLSAVAIHLLVLAAAWRLNRLPILRLSRWLWWLGMILLIACIVAVAYTLSPMATFGFHPYGLAVLILAAALFIGASLEVKFAARKGEKK